MRAIRPLLPAEAFAPNPRAYIPIVAHLAVVVCGWFACRYLPSMYWPIFGILIGNSLAALAFRAHDISHGSVVKDRYLQYPTELVVWALLYTPATLWKLLHNNHHAYTNSDLDPDRRFLPHELTAGAGLYSLVIVPNKHLRYNLLSFLHFATYTMRHGFTALFFPGTSKPSMITAKPRYTGADKIWIALEVVFVVAVQIGIAIIVRKAFFWASIFPLIIMSAVVSWYFFTNHGLRPIGDGDDILGAATTVVVPNICNRLHSNFSYHAEHHLFPSMNPLYCPMVSKIFLAKFPDRYHRISIFEAWSELWRNKIAGSRHGALEVGRVDSPVDRISPAASFNPIELSAHSK